MLTKTELTLEEKSDCITQLLKINDRLFAYCRLKTYVESEWEIRQIENKMKPLRQKKAELKTLLEQEGIII